jgi:Domain of unknown function (DUF4440)
MATSQRSTEIEQLERAFWQSIVDNDPKIATGLLTEPALMVSGHGAMSFDHAGYTKMAKDGTSRLLAFDFSKMEVLFPTDDVAIATYHVRQTREVDGKSTAMDVVDSSTWVKVDGAWKCAAHTESEAAAKK